MHRIHLHSALAALFVVSQGCGKGDGPPSFERPPAPVTAAVAIAKDVPLYLDAIGRVVASETVSVVPQVSGRVTAVGFVDGADVKVGDPLFSIDDRPCAARLAEAAAKLDASNASPKEAEGARDTAKARVETARSRVAEAKASLEAAHATEAGARADVEAAEADAARATADQKRFEGMGAGGGVSQMDLDRMRAEAQSTAARLDAARRKRTAAAAQEAAGEAAVGTSEAGVREAESLAAEASARITSATAGIGQASAAVTSARLDLEYCRIASPISGRAGRRLVDAGNVVTPAGGPLVVVEKVDPAYVEFTATETELSAVQRNMARGPLDAEIRLPDDLEHPRAGTLTFLDNTVDEATGTVRLRATIENADRRFWPGRFAKVRLVLATLSAAVLVPSLAPQVSPAGTFVYVVKADGKAEMRPVTLGQPHEGLVVISKGLAAGERVVVDGQLGVTPGGMVRVAEPLPTAPEAMGAEDAR